MTRCTPSRRCKSCREMQEAGAIIHKDIHNEKKWAVDPRRDEIEIEAEKSYAEVKKDFDQVPENIEEIKAHMNKWRNKF